MQYPPELIDKVIAEFSETGSKAETARRLGMSRSKVRRIIAASEDIPQDSEPPPSIIPHNVTPDQVHYPTHNPQDRILELEAELERLKIQLQWAFNSPEENLAGGTFTLNLSDLHFHDRGFMQASFESLKGKTLELIDRFKPRRFAGIVNGDIIPGRGIYRNQDMEAILPRADQQIAAGAYKFLEFDWAFENKFKNMPREWLILKGNHDYSRGEPTSMAFVATILMFGVNARYVGTEWVHNCADRGTYNVLFEHGYGSSTYGPTSNKMVVETLIKIIDYQHRGVPIHRVGHGHSHWLVSDFQRGALPWDTTGGLQRNERANIGKNTRPVGWIAYVSPPKTGDILRPIEIRPSQAALRQDLDDPVLVEKNRADAARCLKAFAELCEKLGFVQDVRRQFPPKKDEKSS